MGGPIFKTAFSTVLLLWVGIGVWMQYHLAEVMTNWFNSLGASFMISVVFAYQCLAIIVIKDLWGLRDE